MSTITFTQTEHGVAGFFPAGLVKGVKSFEFTVQPTATEGALSYINCTGVVINGVEHYLHIHAATFAPAADHHDWRVRRAGFSVTTCRYDWVGVSRSASTAADAVAGLITNAMKFEDVVANEVIKSRRDEIAKKIFTLHEENVMAQIVIDRRKVEIAKLEGERRALADVAVTATELSLITTLKADGLHTAEAVAAAKSALK
jgi:hypothetical protein